MNPYIGHRGVERLLHATLICLEAIGICHEGLGNLSVPRGRGAQPSSDEDAMQPSVYPYAV